MKQDRKAEKKASDITTRERQLHGRRRCLGRRNTETLRRSLRETRKDNQKIMKKYKENGDRHFTDEGRVAEFTIVWVLLARANMSENKVSGPGDSIVSAMIKQLPHEKVHEITRCFQDRFMELDEVPNEAGIPEEASTEEKR